MKSLSPNTKIDFRKLLATVHGLPNSTNRFGSGAVKTYSAGSIIIRWKKFILKCTHLFHVLEHYSYVLMHIYIEDMRTKKALSERSVFS